MEERGGESELQKRSPRMGEGAIRKGGNTKNVGSMILKIGKYSTKKLHTLKDKKIW